MKKLFNIRVLTVLVLLGLVSCEKSPEPVGILEEDASLDVQEAKAWFEGVSKNARTAGEEVYSQVYWKYAFETKADKERKQSVVIVPISHGRKGRAYGYKQLWVYKGRDKKNTMRVVEFVYDKDIPRKDLGKYSFKNFTGAMIVRNWDDEILGGFRWKEGKKATVLKLESVTVNGKKEDVKKPKNGRITGCEFEMNTWGQYVTVGGVEIDRWTQYDGEWNCSWEDFYGWDTAPPGDSDGGGGYWSGGGGSGGDYGSGPGDSYFKKVSIHDSPCEGFKQALAAQTADNKEMMGLLTTDGRVILLPNDNNSKHESHFYFDGPPHNDLNNRPLIQVAKENGTWNAMIYYYDGDNTASNRQEQYNIKGVFHTHPMESGYDWDGISPPDKLDAATWPDLPHFMINNKNFLRFDSTGETDRLRKWQDNCGSISSFVN